MSSVFRTRTLLLFIGDIVFFVCSLWLSLYLRALTPPSTALFLAHLRPFSLLFVAWVIVFFIAGLYESRSIILERRMISATLLVAQVCNIIIAALFFFLIPSFGIAPKTVLLIYLVVSFVLEMLWRVALFPLIGLRRQERALVVGAGQEIDQLIEAIAQAPRAPTRIAATLAPHAGLAHDVRHAIVQYRPGFIIADFNDPAVSGAFPELYNYLAQGIRFIDASFLYEDIFGRVPLSVLDDRWIARNVSRYSHMLYDVFKRIIDVVVALPAAIIAWIVYPFIACAIKLEDGGPVFVLLPRVGQDEVIQIKKFRSMSGNDAGDYGQSGTTQLFVTRVGKFLRVSRLDELPQLWSVVRGDLSLIGPRPETPALVAVYEKEIPYYGVRHLVKPGLSGWAQLYHDNHPHHGTEVEATREKLSYDLYYLKHRSLLLDVTIVLKTIKKLFTRSGA